MINFFLRAKHWQLFLMIFGLPMVFYIVMMYSMFTTLSSAMVPGSTTPDKMVMDAMMSYIQFLPVVIILFTGVLYAWYWSVTVGLRLKVPTGVHLNMRLFKIFLFIPLVYLISFGIVISIAITTMFSGAPSENMGVLGPLVAIVVPLHLFSMFCIFYTMYFVAKTIKTVELQREASFSDFVGEFFLIWFYPIGIWILQPKINQLADGSFANKINENSTVLDDTIGR